MTKKTGNIVSKSYRHLPLILAIISSNLLLILFTYFTRHRLPPVVPLFYGRPLGNEQLAPKLFLIIPPAISIVITLVNLSLISFTKDKFLHAILLGLSIIVTILSTITVIKISLLVGNY